MQDYKICPHCGATLDHDGPCNCIKRMYTSLTPENRRTVDDLIGKLLEKRSEKNS